MGARLLHPRQPAPDLGALAAANLAAYEARRVALALPDGARTAITRTQRAYIDVWARQLQVVHPHEDQATAVFRAQAVLAAEAAHLHRAQLGQAGRPVFAAWHARDPRHGRRVEIVFAVPARAQRRYRVLVERALELRR